jgi:hypothetical protein
MNTLAWSPPTAFTDSWGKLKKVALVAAMRTYPTILNAMTRDHLKAAAANRGGSRTGACGPTQLEGVVNVKDTLYGPVEAYPDESSYTTTVYVPVFCAAKKSLATFAP